MPDPTHLDFPKIDEVFDDTIETWTGYLLTWSDTPYSSTLYLRERCRLIELFEDLEKLVLIKGESSPSTVQGFVNGTDDLLAKLQRFLERLPAGLQYRWHIRACAGIVESWVRVEASGRAP